MWIRADMVPRKHSIISHTRNRKVDSCRHCHGFPASLSESQRGIAKPGFVMWTRADVAHREDNLVSHRRNRKVNSRRPCHAFMALELLDHRDYVLSVPCGVRLRLFVNARTSVSWSCSGSPDHSKPCFVFLVSGRNCHWPRSA